MRSRPVTNPDRIALLLVGAALLQIAACGSAQTWEGVNEQAKTALQEGRHEDARRLFGRALELAESAGEPGPQLVAALNNMGLFHQSRGEIGEALPYYRRALEIRETLLGPDNPELAADYDNMAIHCQQAGELTA